MKKLGILFLGFTVLGTFLIKPSFFLNTANRNLTHSKLNVSSPLKSAFNNESLHAGIGGTWSGADKGGRENK